MSVQATKQMLRNKHTIKVYALQPKRCDASEIKNIAVVFVLILRLLASSNVLCSILSMLQCP